jgi:hypothetical protein
MLSIKSEQWLEAKFRCSMSFQTQGTGDLVFPIWSGHAAIIMYVATFVGCDGHYMTRQILILSPSNNSFKY